MLNHESRIKKRNEYLEISLQTKEKISRGRGIINRGKGRRGRSYFQFGRRHGAENQVEQPLSQSQNQRERGIFYKSNIHCYYFKRYGNFESGCRKKQANQTYEELMYATWKKKLIQCFYHTQ